MPSHFNLLRHRLLLGCLAALALAAAPAGPAHRVKDINTNPEELPGDRGGTLVAGKTLYFTLLDRLWKSDGTAAGTQPVGGTGTLSLPNLLAARGPIVYFTAVESGLGRELWRTDGTTEGTRMVRDINPGPGDPGIQELLSFRGELYFSADDGVHGRELWKTDGTTDGTVLAADLNPGSRGSSLSYLRVGSLRAGGASLFFSESTYVPLQSSTLYSSDGTVNGTRLLGTFVNEYVSDYCPGPCFGQPPAQFVPFRGLTYFIASDGVTGLELWRANETTRETSLVKDICPGPCHSFATPLQVVNGRLFFFADDGVHGSQPWTSDGTEAGTRLVKEIYPGAPDRYFLGYGGVAAGGAFFFSVSPDGTNFELWRSDGTESGTFRVTAGIEGSGPGNITPVGDTVYFTGATASGGRGLWKTNPAGARPTFVTDLVSEPTRLVDFGGSLYFTAPGPSGFSLWKTDGSPAGTAAVGVVQRGNASSNALPMADSGGSLLFFANVGNDTSGLWKSDGTDAGTQPVAPVYLYSYSEGVNGVFTPFRGAFLFGGYDTVHGAELWRTDGTPNGTRLVKDIAAAGGSSPCGLTAFGDALYFRATGVSGSEGFWKTDGTESGTEFIKNIFPLCLPDRKPPGFVPFGGLLYFSGRTSSESGFWRSDGTSQGTERIRLLSAGGLMDVGGRLIFMGSDKPDYSEFGLWTSDGTAAGTVRLKAFPSGVGPFVRFSGGAFFLAATVSSRTQLWRTDGTQTGTTLVADGGPFFWRDLIVMGDRIFFAAQDAENGVELWTSDGTAAGTHIVKDIAAGATDSNPRNLTAIDGVLLFSAADRIHGDELWRSDGTAAGTFLLQDISPGPTSSSPGSFTKAGSLVFFAAADTVAGTELWAMPLSALASTHPEQKGQESTVKSRK